MHVAKKHKILFCLILWRLTSVVVVQTAHVPDEYWQSLEVAHRLAFGYGYLTWEWTAKIRSYLYPFLISLLYRLLTLLSLDHAAVLTTVPKLIQGVLTAYGEYKFYEWTGNKWMLYSLCINWYWYYCATRTLINTVETAFTMIALSIFPWRDSNVRSIKFLWIVGLLCMIRPTAAIIWMPLCLYHFSTSTENKFLLICKYALICGTCFLSSVFIDSYYYGSLVISPWEFFRVNVVYKAGDAYGKEHILWYIFSAFPVLLGLYYIIFLFNAWQVIKYPAQFHRQAILLIVISWTLCIYSLLSHKEFRFLLPLLPMMIHISTSCPLRLNVRISEVTRKIFLVLLIVTNVFPGLYFCLIHQRGSLDVMKVIREDISHSNYTESTVLFLTPCHATPLYSHLHKNITTKILTCEPNLNATDNYMDEADRFFAGPMRWLSDNYINVERNKMPTHVILFDSISPKITKFLQNFQIIAKVFHAHFPQSNYGKYIFVYRRK